MNYVPLLDEQIHVQEQEIRWYRILAGALLLLGMIFAVPSLMGMNAARAESLVKELGGTSIASLVFLPIRWISPRRERLNTFRFLRNALNGSLTPEDRSTLESHAGQMLRDSAKRS